MSGPHSERGGALPSLKDAEWLKRPQTARVFAALSKDCVVTRAVGGAVRNTLLGLPVIEVDLATTALPERVMALVKAAGLKAVPTGIEHGTVTVIADGTPFEVTTLRRDVETYGRHATVAFTADWEEDAKRRDFTLNALYADCDGTVFDPLGGYGDLVAGHVRFIGSAEARIKEDYLRILRFFRFNAYYGNAPLDAEGLAACVRLRAGLSQLSAERVAGELRRILVAPRAVCAVEALFDYGLLTEVLGGAPRMMRFARLVAAEEALGLSPDPALRLAALAVFVAEDAERLATRLRLSNAEQAVLMLGANDHARVELPGEVAARRSFYKLGPCKFEAHVLLAAADEGVAPDDAHWQQALRLADRWQVPEFPLRGPDITALGDLKGPEIGEMLRKLEAEWIASDFTLGREALLAKAKQLLNR
jgi:tRNA nucleotidyltransferase/poly(A) polymerase